MKIALVHDYLKEFGGAERVLSTLHEMFPDAPIYTLFSQGNSQAANEFRSAKIVQSWFAFIPFHEKLISPFRFLIPLMWAGFNFDNFDLVISSSSWAITKGFANGKTREICYCHTPPRYLYGYETSRNWKKHWYIRTYATIVNHFMRMYDFKRAQKVSQFVANSLETQKRIEKFYRRDSVVIYPPVDVQIFDEKKQDFILTGGRIVLQKNFDLIIKACESLGIKLKIYGGGPEEDNLKALAKKNVDFLGRISEEEKFRLMTQAKAFVIAALDEDFGITPVEAMAVGTPVVAYRGGGYLETVVNGKTGLFFDHLTTESLSEALKKVFKMKFKKEDLEKHAEKFSKEKFVEKMKGIINA